MKVTRTKRQKGFVLMTMALVSVALLGAVGLAVDMGRIFIVRNETQAFCDSAAVAAVAYLNNTSDAVQTADAVAKATAIKWNFGTTTISSPTVEYATSPTGTWFNATHFPTPPSNTGCVGGVGNTDPACGFKYVRVKTSVQVPLYFLPVVQTTKTYTQTVNSQAIAGQVDITGPPVSPYTGVSEGCFTINAPVNGVGSGCPVGTPAVGPPNFGLTIGDNADPSVCNNNNIGNGKNPVVGCYDIQWSKFNNPGVNKCNPPTKTDGCFVSPPCADDQGNTTSESAVATQWASSSNGYWGAQAASSVGAETIDYAPNPGWPVVVPGDNLGTGGANVMTSGQQQSQTTYLDERVNQDGDNYDTSYSTYLKNSAHNGRRLMIAPIVWPNSVTQTVVQGYGLFFLISNASQGGQSDYYKKKTVGNDPFCAVYVGTACVGCTSNGVGGNTGAAAVKLVQ